jgi:hypothetical protein
MLSRCHAGAWWFQQPEYKKKQGRGVACAGGEHSNYVTSRRFIGAGPSKISIN